MSKMLIKIKKDGISEFLFESKNNETKIFDTLSYKIIKSDFNTFRQTKEIILKLSQNISKETLNDNKTSDGANYNLKFSYNEKSLKFEGYSRISNDKNFAELHEFILSFIGYFAHDYEY